MESAAWLASAVSSFSCAVENSAAFSESGTAFPSARRRSRKSERIAQYAELAPASARPASPATSLRRYSPQPIPILPCPPGIPRAEEYSSTRFPRFLRPLPIPHPTSPLRAQQTPPESRQFARIGCGDSQIHQFLLNNRRWPVRTVSGLRTAGLRRAEMIFRPRIEGWGCVCLKLRSHAYPRY